MYFKSPEGQYQLLANTSQVGVPSIAQPVTYLRTIEIPLPPLPEQRAIAHILGTLDDKIELNRRMNETLEKMARALFKSWFVDFLPVRAKQRTRTQTGDLVRAKAALIESTLRAEVVGRRAASTFISGRHGQETSSTSSPTGSSTRNWARYRRGGR